MLQRVLGVALVAFMLTASGRASACGGTFCDGGSQPMPVDQSGETVVFVQGGQNVEAHIQIEYEGDPARFAWLIPVPEVPEVEIGTQAFFDALLNATVPSFQLQSGQRSCVPTPSGGCGFSSPSSGGNLSVFSGADAGAASDADDPVVARQTVGAFDVTVLEPSDENDVEAWLDENGFLNDSDAPPIIADYIEKGHVFVALRLTPGAGVDQIHPIVVRYPGDEPCVPLKLTSIAAVDDMAIRVFFLGARRSVPLNYRHVELNPFRFDWLNRGTNYNTVLSEAVDEQGADGQAFVTEYAGPSSIVPESSVTFPDWQSRDFAGVAPEDVPEVLMNQNLLACSTSAPQTPDGDGFALCAATHPMVVPLLRRHLPAPPGVDENLFYARTDLFADQIDREVWNEAAFVANYEQWITEPAEHAKQLLERWPHLTRMATTISPEEMTEDPIFLESPSKLPQVSQQWNATQTIPCDGPSMLTIEETTFELDVARELPSDRSLPAARLVTTFSMNGDEGYVQDNEQTIEDALPAEYRTPRGSEGCVVTTSSRVSLPEWLFAAALLGLLRRRRPA